MLRNRIKKEFHQDSKNDTFLTEADFIFWSFSSIQIWFSGGSSNFRFYNISEIQVDCRVWALDSVTNRYKGNKVII